MTWTTTQDFAEWLMALSLEYKDRHHLLDVGTIRAMLALAHLNAFTDFLITKAQIEEELALRDKHNGKTPFRTIS